MALSLPVISFGISYGTDAWATPAYVEESGRLRSFKSKIGRQHLLQAFDAGTNTCRLHNRDREVDPTWMGSSHAGQLVPGVRYRLTATWAGITYPIFVHFAERWQPEWADPAAADVVLTGVDAWKKLKKKKLQTQTYHALMLSYAPRAYYRFDDTSGTVAVDSSGNARNGVYLSGGFWSQSQPQLGADGSLLSEPSSKSMFSDQEWDAPGSLMRPKGYAQAPAAAGATGNALTIPIRFRTNVGDAQQREIVEVANSGGFPEVRVFVESGVLKFNPASGTYSSGVAVNDGLWHSLHLTRASDGKTWKLYLDGAQVATHVDAAVQTLTAFKTSFGGTYGNGGYFIGWLDEAAIIDAELTGAQVAAMHTLADHIWPSELSGARINRALDNVGWPAGDRAIDAGSSTVRAAFTDLSETSVLDHMQKVEESESGFLFDGPDGKITFLARNSLLSPPYTNVAATFGDGPGEIPYEESPETWVDDDNLVSEVLGQRIDGEQQRWFSSAGEAQFGPASMSKSDLLLVDDGEVLDLVNWLGSLFGAPQQRVETIRIHATADPATMFPVLLALAIGDTVMVRGRPVPKSTDPWEATCMVEGIEHEMTEDGDWWTTLHLSPAAYSGYWILGTSELGVSTRLAF